MTKTEIQSTRRMCNDYKFLVPQYQKYYFEELKYMRERTHRNCGVSHYGKVHIMKRKWNL